MLIANVIHCAIKLPKMKIYIYIIWVILHWGLNKAMHAHDSIFAVVIPKHLQGPLYSGHSLRQDNGAWSPQNHSYRNYDNPGYVWFKIEIPLSCSFSMPLRSLSSNIFVIIFRSEQCNIHFEDSIFKCTVLWERVRVLLDIIVVALSGGH